MVGWISCARKSLCVAFHDKNIQKFHWKNNYNCREQSPYWEANRSTAGQEIPCILWNCFHKCPQPVPIMTQWIQSTPSNPTSWRSSLILFSHLLLGLPSGLLSSELPTNTLDSNFIYIYIYICAHAKCRISYKHTKYTRHTELLQHKCYKDFINSIIIIIIILSFCPYVEHKAFMKLFHLLLRLVLLPPSSLPQLPFCCSFPGCSWSTPLPCTLRVPVQCMSFYCSLWLTWCMADPAPVSFIYLLFNRCLFCSLP